jgi:hypothetical protein
LNSSNCINQASGYFPFTGFKLRASSSSTIVLLYDSLPESLMMEIMTFYKYFY